MGLQIIEQEGTKFSPATLPRTVFLNLCETAAR